MCKTYKYLVFTLILIELHALIYEELSQFKVWGSILGSSCCCSDLKKWLSVWDADGVTITPRDARWVGAWWLGFLVSSSLLLVSGIPFWFLPRSLPKQEGEEDKPAPRHVSPDGTEETLSGSHDLKLTEIAKGTSEVCVQVQELCWGF